MLSIANRPSELVSVESTGRLPPCSMRLTVAFGTDAPVGSTTDPVNRPVTWAQIDEEKMTNTLRTNRTEPSGKTEYNVQSSTAYRRTIAAMKIVFLCALLGACSMFAARPVEEFKTKAGALKITPIQHASFMIEAGGQVVHVDPSQGDYTGVPPADLILITD